MRSERVSVGRLGVSAAVLLLALPSMARAEWIVGAFLGHAATRSSTVTLTLPERGTSVEIEGVEYRGEPFKSPQYYGYRVMWAPDARRWLGVEFEVIHAKVFAQAGGTVRLRGMLRGAPVDATVPLSSLVQRLAMSHGLNFLLANVAVRRDLGPVDARGRPRLMVVVRAGAGPTIAHAESTVEHVNRDEYQGGGIGAQGSGALEVSIWRGLGLVGEYKFTWATPTIDVAGGEATIPSRSHHFVAGLAYHF